MSDSNYIPIPGPRGVPFLGNVLDVDPELPEQSFSLMADNYGSSSLRASRSSS